MKTLVYAGPGKVEVQEKPFPELRPGQVRIKVHYCGICGSDIGIFSGKHPRAKAPLVLGHEFIGIIEETAEDSKKFKKGGAVSALILRGMLCLCQWDPSCVRYFKADRNRCGRGNRGVYLLR